MSSAVAGNDPSGLSCHRGLETGSPRDDASVTEDLVAFLKARLIEDRRIEEGASSPAPGRKTGEAEEWEWWDSSSDERVTFDGISDGSDLCTASLRTVNTYLIPWTGTGRPDHYCRLGGASVGGGTAVHIARHDPARVLAEVTAKLAIVREYEETARRAQEPEGDDIAVGAMNALREVLRRLVRIYADHPGYQRTW